MDTKRDISEYDVLHAIENAEVVDIICPHCQKMTRVEPLTDKDWFCYDCNRFFTTD